MGKEYKWQRRERKQKNAKNRMPKHGKGQAQIYADSIEKREKDKEKLIGRINKMLMKQTPLEDTMGKNLPTIKPQQLASVTNQPMPQAAQQIKQQQTQNRQVGQNAPQQPKPPAQRSIQFGPTGADLMPNELKQRLDSFNTLNPFKQVDAAITLDAKNPQDYEMAKYLARTGSPKVQIAALNKLSSQDLDATVQPTNPNSDAVSILARKTQNPSYMRSLTKHASPQVRMSLVKNPNITDLTRSEMYDDKDDQVRNHIVGQSDNQELLHLFISDKNPQIRARLIDKVDHDGLKILSTDPDPYVAAMAKRKLSGRFSKMEKAVDGKRTVFIPAEEDEIDSQLTTASKEKLPEYGYGTPVGAAGTAGGTQPSFSTKSLLKSIDTLIEKAEEEVDYQVLKPPQIQAWIDEQVKYAREHYPDIDIDNMDIKNLSPQHSRIMKPILYAKQILQDYPELNAIERGRLIGIVKKGRIEGMSLLRDSGPFGLHLQSVLSHIKNADINNPGASKGIGTALARRNIEMGSNSGKTLSIQPDVNATDFWRKFKEPINGMITIKPKEYSEVIAKLTAPPKIENEMEEEFTSYVEPLRKDKIMKEYGVVGDVSTVTYGGSEGQNYRKKIGSALKFKSVEGIFDVMKAVSEDFNFEENNG